MTLGYEPERPLVALAFKLEDGRYGQLTYVRIYQGTLKKGEFIWNVRTNKKVKVGRLVRMHSNEMEDITEACGGDLVALFGVDCSSGDTFTDGTVRWTMSSMHVPEPVINLMIKPVDNKAQINMSKALSRFTREDPTFRTYVDQESGETIVCGMGELHLEVYIERMKREYGAEVETGAPQVAYRETIGRAVEYDYTHKKQTGGSGQYGRVLGTIEPNEESDFEFESKIVGGVIAKEFIPSVEKGFRSQMAKGRLIGFPVVNIRFTLTDGNMHPVDSSTLLSRKPHVALFAMRTIAPSLSFLSQLWLFRSKGQPNSGRYRPDVDAASWDGHRYHRGGRFHTGGRRRATRRDVCLLKRTAFGDSG